MISLIMKTFTLLAIVFISSLSVSVLDELPSLIFYSPISPIFLRYILILRLGYIPITSVRDAKIKRRNYQTKLQVEK